MSRVIVSEKAIRDLIKEVFSSSWSGWSDPDEISPVNVNDVVDPSASITDPGNDNYVPSNKVELQVTLKSLSNDLSDADIPKVYDNFVSAIEKNKKDEKEMKRNAKVENYVRSHIRRMLWEGILGPDEEYASDSEVKAWKPGQPLPSGHDMSYDKKGNEILVKKAMMPPGGVPVTKVPMGTGGSQKLTKYKGQLQTLLGKSDDDAPVSVKEFKRWVGSVISVSEAMDYRDIYIEAYKLNNQEENQYSDWGMTTESPNFERMFKKKFGKTFRNYTLPLGKKIKERMSSGTNYSAADITGSEADNLAEELGVSRSELKNMEDQTLAKFALGMLAEMPDEDEVKFGLGTAPVQEGISKAINIYTNVLITKGQLSKGDADLLREHPELVVDLPGFKNFLKRNLHLRYKL